MAYTTPKTARQWNVTGHDGSGLKFSEQPVPDIGDDEVLVKLHGASLNYRDLMVPRGQYPWGVKAGVVPGSDGAGVVIAVGKHVTRFQSGDKVVTMLLPQHIAGPVVGNMVDFGLGASVDGTFRSVGAFSEHGLVAMPEGLTFTEAATLSCAGLTAWNALFGLAGRQVSAGQWVLTQGTGGVSIFAVQFAKAVGARVIATTSSSEKAKLLEKLGADYIINYREITEWGAEAKRLTGGAGVDLVLEVAGPPSIKQSAASVKLDGTISVVGSVGGGGKANGMPSLMDCWMSLFTARGVWVGNRLQMEDMCRAIEGNIEKLRPVLDPKVFSLDQLQEAYEYLESGKHQGKVGIKID
ncbi:zinc-binding dehydrogenase [Hypoxylon sp. FL1284]|nr:zinc-binding dehydrogenase [Hypoxylon sp. FL1284]